MSNVPLISAVQDALDWLKVRPHRDYLDAAYAVSASPTHRTTYGAVFSTSRWPELVAAVKEAIQKPPHMS